MEAARDDREGEIMEGVLLHVPWLDKEAEDQDKLIRRALDENLTDPTRCILNYKLFKI